MLHNIFLQLLLKILFLINFNILTFSEVINFVFIFGEKLLILQCMSGIYFHIPICHSKCIYCDFYSLPCPAVDMERLTDAMFCELDSRLGELRGDKVSTIYFGGGTPSLLPPPLIEKLLARVPGDMIASTREMTIEVNPEDVNADKCRVWKAMGFNRVSMGVQSFDDRELKQIGRRHSAQQAIDTYNILRSHFDNISLDLIYGLPGQTPDSWARNLARVLELSPEHLSAYSLMFEEGTALTKLRDTGRVAEIADDDSIKMFELLIEKTREAGYIQYEISNFAKSGYESKHNSSYWNSAPYLGIGPAACSYDGRLTRTSNLPDIKAYTGYFLEGKGSRPADIETLTVEEVREEYILTRMRTREGIPVSDFAARFGNQQVEKLLHFAEKLQAKDLVEVTDGILRLTDKGVMVADSVILELAM